MNNVKLLGDMIMVMDVLHLLMIPYCAKYETMSIIHISPLWPNKSVLSYISFNHNIDENTGS